MESSTLSDCEVRVVIKFLNVEDVTGLEIHHRLSNVYDAGNAASLCHVYIVMSISENFPYRYISIFAEKLSIFFKI